jgi:hypothetical protein
MPIPHKWTPPTPSQEYKRILAEEDRAILEAYVKAGDPAAIAYKQAQEDSQQSD